MPNGIYVVKREEKMIQINRQAKASANAELGEQQQGYGDEAQLTFVVTKVLDDTGQPKRKLQKLVNFGISVVDDRVTDMPPNKKFVERLQLKQKASADCAIAWVQRIQEEEQRLLAITKGEREVAERQAQAKLVQIQKTTEAETEKRLAITAVTKLKEQARIEKETADINFEKTKVEAEIVKTLADAEAYKKKVILQADNALAQKLEAEVKIQSLWAQANSKRRMPITVFGAGG